MEVYIVDLNRKSEKEMWNLIIPSLEENNEESRIWKKLKATWVR